MRNPKIQFKEDYKKLSVQSEIEELRNKVSFYEKFFKYNKSVLYSYDAVNKRFLHLSESVQELLGYTVEEFENSKTFFNSKYIHPEDYPRIFQIFDKLLKSEPFNDSEILFYRIKTKDDVYKWVRDKINVLKDQNGIPCCYQGIISLTTENDAIVQRIQADQRFYQDIIDSNPNLMYIKNIKGQFFLVNKAMARLFEMDTESLLSRLNSDLEVNHTEKVFKNRKEAEVLEDDKTTTTTEKFITPSGRTYWFKTTKSPLTFKDGRKFILVNSTDITQNIFTQKELKENEARYKNLINSLNIPYIMVDNKLKITVINKYALSWFGIGLSSDEIIGKPVTYLLKKQKFIGKKQIADVLNTSGEYEFETAIKKENKILWVWATLQPVKNLDEETIGVQILLFDVTDRKNIEEELKERENILSAIINSTVDVITLHDTDGNIILINDSGANRLNEDIENIKGRRISDILSEKLPITKDDLIKIKKPLRIVYEVKGSVFDTSFYPIKNDQGKTLYYATFARDITELKKAEKQVRESEVLLRSLLKNIPLDFWAQDLNSQLIFQSDIGKLVSSQIVNDSLKPITQESNLNEEEKEVINRVFRGETIKREIDDVASNNIYHNYYSILSPIREYEDITGILGINIDMTHRKIIEQRLRQNEQTLRSIINATSDIIYLVDDDFRIITANTQAEKFSNIELANLVGKPILEVFDKEKELFALNAIKGVMRTKKPYKLEIKFNDVYYTVEYRPILQSEGKVYRIVVIFSDITPLKLAEIEIRNALLREKELNQLKSSVISNVSHEFRTPLAVMYSNLQLIDKYTNKLTYDDYQKKIQLIFNSLRHLKNMLDNISLLDKNYRGMLEFNPEPVEVKKVINSIIDEISSVNSDYNRINLSIKGLEGNYNLDETLLRHILTNLLTNSLKYSLPETYINVYAKYLGKTVELRIEDKGRGMSDKDIANYWEPFYRGGNVENIKGTGLGSSIVKTCIELHNGNIKISSKKGIGTKISLSLPAPKLVE